jgi:hypothetical protein
MQKVLIPYCDRTIAGDGVSEKRGEIMATVDATVFAEERWEKNFPAQAEKETLFAYCDRVKKQLEAGKPDSATVLSAIKAVYCTLESDAIPNFKAFAMLFDYSDKEMFERQMKVITTALQYAGHGSAATPKN